ncbi:Replication protein O [Bacillus sp. V3B]|uniref:Replication protein O n=1 Tax=Bacillus sp. V3B TaxID=2804915 RepID=UPI002109D642|nr:Replication protein O [Bacillus sp. V3B]
MQGWIKLHRQIQGHWLYKEKRIFSKYEAWIDLLMMASHKDTKFLHGAELIELEEGSLVTSELKLMERWKWGKSKLRKFLEILEKDGMIIKKSDRKKTMITICKYSVYHHSEIENGPQADYEQTTGRPSADTIKNVKNVKNVKNDKEDINTSCYKPKTYDEESVPYQLSLRLLHNIRKNNEAFKEPDLQKWSNDIRLMMDRDNRTKEQIAYLIDWCQQDSFWKSNILSPAKLRKQFDQLVIKAEKGKKKSIQDFSTERPYHWEKPKPLTKEEYSRMKELEADLL